MFNLDDANYNFKKVDFNVDGSLGDHIKEPFPNQSFFWLIVGKPGSGKTSLLINSLINKKENRVYRKVFDKILLVMPKNSRSSIKNNPLDDLPEDQLFENMGDHVIEKIKNIREEFGKDKNKNQLLILDDITAYLKTDPQSLIELTTNRRHLKLSIIILVQFIRAVPRPVRFQVTHCTFFKPSNNLDLQIIQEEFINIDKKDFQKLTQFIFVNNHDFLMIDKNNETYYKNLQKIII